MKFVRIEYTVLHVQELRFHREMKEIKRKKEKEKIEVGNKMNEKSETSVILMNMNVLC